MKVVLENIAVDFPQKSWVTLALPRQYQSNTVGRVVLNDKREFPAVYTGSNLFVKADLNRGELVEGTFEKLRDIDPAVDAFKFSPYVANDFTELLPRFKLQMNGVWHESEPLTFGATKNYFKVLESNPVRQVWYINTRIEPCDVTIEGWFYMFTEQDHVEFDIHAIFGSANGTRALNRAFGSLQMITKEATIVDFATRLGVRPRIYTYPGVWETELVSPRTWTRAARQRAFGAMLCLPPYDTLPSLVNDPEFVAKWNNLTARQQAPIKGIADVHEGNFLSVGKVPTKHNNSEVLIRNAYLKFLQDVNRPGDSYAERSYAQPPRPGQTGEQADFGVAKLELAVTHLRPVFLWEYDYHVMAWHLRPYANKESDGTPVKKANHPNTRTYNLRPDERFSRSDMLGWPDPVPFFEWYSTSDDQHRSDNLLLGLYAVTRDYGLKAIIEDMIELEKMNIIQLISDAPIGAPRGWGRPLLSLAHMYALGFTDVEPLIRRHVSYMFRNSSFQRIPKLPDRTVRVFMDNGGKYGWTDLTGGAIRAWVCWEESIAVIGLWAVWKALKIEEARIMAVTVAETICRHAFFQEGNPKRWSAAYSVRWDTANPGKPLPNEVYYTAFPEGSNKDVFAYPMQRWMLPSLMIIRDNPSMFQADVVARATEIINYFIPTGKPNDLNESGWWAI